MTSLALIGHGDPDWGDIYSALEAIVRSLRTAGIESTEWSALEELGWLAEAEASRLKRNANFHRHPKGGRETPPARQFTLDEAAERLRSVIRRWIRWKAS